MEEKEDGQKISVWIQLKEIFKLVALPIMNRKQRTEHIGGLLSIKQ